MDSRGEKVRYHEALYCAACPWELIVKDGVLASEQRDDEDEDDED